LLIALEGPFYLVDKIKYTSNPFSNVFVKPHRLKGVYKTFSSEFNNSFIIVGKALCVVVEVVINKLS